MRPILLDACVLVAITVIVHAVGLALLLGFLVRSSLATSARLWPTIRGVILMVWWLILVHLTEVCVWGLYYLWRGCLPDAESAFYFSGVTYTTIGYGDLVLEKPWRLLGPIEGLSGILMCGLSTGVFFAVMNQLFRLRRPMLTSAPTTEET